VNGFSIDMTGDEEHTVVVAVGELDLAATDSLWATLDAQITPGRTVTLECSGVGFVDSMGLRTLIKAVQKAEAVGGRFDLTGVTPPVWRVLDLAGVAEVFGVSPFTEVRSETD
jgi:anti-anti-sigma factor